MELTSNTMLVLLLIFVVIFLLSGQKNEMWGSTRGLVSSLPPGAVKCSDESGMCQLPRRDGDHSVYYGAGNKWAFQNVGGLRGWIKCSPSDFGGDPVPFVRKECYYAA
jgi:hypothetical protein